MTRIYADHAATSWPKPPGVVAAMTDYLNQVGVSHGRGGSAAAVEADRLVSRCRGRLRRLFGVTSDDRIIFTAGGTDGLNLVIRGLLRPGDHAVASQVDHNAVLRPLAESSAETTIVPATTAGVIDTDAWTSAMRSEPKLVCINHASNVTGTVQPVAELAAVAKRTGAVVLLDACQTAGDSSIDWAALGVDYIATGTHKGLLGVLGLGVLVRMNPNAPRPTPLRFGGTGLMSESPRQPQSLPDYYEAGSLNTPAIAALDAALALRGDHATPPLDELDEALATGGWFVAGQGTERTATRCVWHEAMSATEAASVLEGAFGVEVRAGLHCAPLMHEAIGSPAGGAVRFSFGPTSTPGDVTAAADAVRALAMVPS